MKEVYRSNKLRFGKSPKAKALEKWGKLSIDGLICSQEDNGSQS